MATANTIKVTPENTGLWHVHQTESAAKKATELLQKDLEEHHVFFNHDGYHNHISHQILALYGAGAPPDSLERAYEGNKGYQRPTEPVHGNPAEEFRDWDAAKPHLGKEEHYADFLVFFQGEIDRLGGWENTLLEYMFKGDERSDDMLLRMFAGLLHPIIQLMYGIEWRQPAIVAMALAQAAVHSGESLQDILPAAEEAAAAAPMPSIVDLLDAVRADHAEQAAAARQGVVVNSSRTLGTLMGRAWAAARKSAERVRVDPRDLDERTAEMYHAALYEGASAALLRYPAGKYPKWDFFIIHIVNLSPIFLSINAQDWIPLAAKVRLLEWKIRFDLLWYAAVGCPELSLDRIVSYEPKDDPKASGADDKLRERIFTLEDDGHAIKLFRAVYVGRHAIEKYEGKGSSSSWLKIRGSDTWDGIAHMVVDSVEAPGPHWVRNAGDPEAWNEIENRST
ncbi:hypothetical protein SLS62_009106 [Diatrype stigma]|uniref:HypA n=1 Tax=Diatrype stigma TaxID=117547 RepID=A0AAN9UN66_9PEZI